MSNFPLCALEHHGKQTSLSVNTPNLKPKWKDLELNELY